MKGATSPCHGARATPCLSQLPHSLTAVAARFAVGGPTLPETVTEELRRRVQRLRSSTDGDFAPTGPPALLNELTDAVLVVASGIVSEAASTLSGKAQLRLLAWLLADARGATSPLDKKLAETVGKRLSAQAQRVRCALDEARSTAELQRAEARAAAALAADAADLPKRLAAIDAAEQQALSAPNTEVYVGFWELGAGSAEALAPAAALPANAAVLAIGPEEPEPEGVPPEWEAAHYEQTQEEAHPYMQKWRREGGAVPPVIARCLGEEGSRLLARSLACNRDATGDEILQVLIPGLVGGLIAEQERERREHADELALVREEGKLEAAALHVRIDDLRESEQIAREEREQMHIELVEAIAKQAALHDVITRNILK